MKNVIFIIFIIFIICGQIASAQTLDLLIGSWIEAESKYDNVIDFPADRIFRKYTFISADTVEITSPTANKRAQQAKEERILNNGGNFVRDRRTGNLCKVNGTCKRIDVK